MPQREIRFRTTTPVPTHTEVDHQALVARFAAIRAELKVPSEFPPDVEAEAERAARDVVLPDRDETDVPFVTVDPVGSMDLDQALHLERAGEGYRVRYAIADVPAYVTPGRGPRRSRRTAGSRRSTRRTSAPRCTRRSSARRPAVCCRTSCGPRSSGTSTLDVRGRQTGATVYRRSGPEPAPGSTTSACSRPSTRAPPTRSCCCSRRSVRSGSTSSPSAAGPACRCPSRR